MAKSTRTSIITDQRYLGKEPDINSEEVLTDSRLIRVYNWYNYFKDTESAKQYLKEYSNHNNIRIDVSKHNNNTYGWIARILSRGGKIDSNLTSRFKNYLESIKHSGKKETLVATKVQEECVKSRLGEWMPDFEDAVDNFKNTFSAYNYFRSHNVPQMYVKRIGEYYEEIYNEVRSAYNKEDKDLVEAYSVHSRSDLKTLMKFLQSITEDCEKYLGNVKKERKPRKPRVKSVDSILKYFKYLKHDDNLKISSEDPAKVLGASSMYVYNTKYKTLTVFHAKDSNGLSVNRTAITNYDEKTSRGKRIGRKAEETINLITGGTKRSRVKVLDTIKTDDIKFSDRINENCIILKIDK